MPYYTKIQYEHNDTFYADVWLLRLGSIFELLTFRIAKFRNVNKRLVPKIISLPLQLQIGINNQINSYLEMPSKFRCKDIKNNLFLQIFCNFISVAIVFSG